MPWFDPLVIHKCHHNSYVLKTLAGNVSMGCIHANRLKKFLLNRDSPEGKELTGKALDSEQAILATVDDIQDQPDPDPDPNTLASLNALPFPTDPVPPTTETHRHQQNIIPPATPTLDDSDSEDHTRKRKPRQAALRHAFINPR